MREITVQEYNAILERPYHLAIIELSQCSPESVEAAEKEVFGHGLGKLVYVEDYDALVLSLAREPVLREFYENGAEPEVGPEPESEESPAAEESAPEPAKKPRKRAVPKKAVAHKR